MKCNEYLFVCLLFYLWYDFIIRVSKRPDVDFLDR